jgi:2-iminobutanoate/2-iminopropanoate deaminase
MKNDMLKTAIATSAAPAAIGPYSQAIRAGNLLFISGQLAIDAATASLIEGDIGTKTRKILANARAIAQAAGTDLDKVVKTTIFLTDLNNFKAVNEAYGEFFQDTPPARSTIQVAGLPLGAEIEIEFIVLCN